MIKEFSSKNSDASLCWSGNQDSGLLTYAHIDGHSADMGMAFRPCLAGAKKLTRQFRDSQYTCCEQNKGEELTRALVAKQMLRLLKSSIALLTGLHFRVFQ